MLAAADGLAARGRLKYRAFISYRRQDATVVARWLRRRLLSFRLPREMLDELSPERRIDAERRVAYFLDTSYQSANEDFWTANIEPALKDTEYLIVLSSPSALQRRTDGSDNWVAREIDTFLKVYGDEEGRQRIIVALAPNAPTESFPGRLGELGTQWDWVDLRTVSLWQWLRPGVADRLSDAFLKVVARLYEIPQHLLPILRREEARRRARVRLLAASSAMVVIAALTAAFVWAMVERGNARLAEQRAVGQRDQALIAQSRYAAQIAHRLSAAGDEGTALALMLDVLPTRVDAPDRPLDRLAEGALLEATLQLRERAVLGGRGKAVRTADFSPDGAKVVADLSDDRVRLWEARTGQEIATLNGHAGCFSPDGAKVATVLPDGSVRLWDAGNGKELATLQGDGTTTDRIEFAPDGSTLVALMNDSTARLWDIGTTKLLATLRGHQGEPISGATFSPDGKMIATTALFEVVLWNARTGAEWNTIGAFKVQVYNSPLAGVSFSRDGKLIVVGTEAGVARLWDIPRKREIAAMRGHTEAINNVAFSADGTKIVTSSKDGTARLWDGRTGRKLAIYKGHAPRSGVTYASFSPDGAVVMTKGEDNKVLLWRTEDVEDAQDSLIVAMERQQDEVSSASFSPDGTRIVTVSTDNTVRVRDARRRSELLGGTGQVMAALNGHEAPVQSAAFSPDGKTILTTSEDGTARLWNAQLSHDIGTLRAPDFSQRAAATGAIASPDGTMAASVLDDNIVVVRDLASGRDWLRLRGEERSITDLRWLPDGKGIATTSLDGTVRIWPLWRGQDLIDRACSVMPRPLTYAQRDTLFLQHEPGNPRCGRKPLN
ncbi:MAG TPA: WD40 repeat domain-containing protein [Reyranella sp.]|nr:WD40 repeat domain-containing protein [Reyranella sp.]